MEQNPNLAGKGSQVPTMTDSLPNVPTFPPMARHIMGGTPTRGQSQVICETCVLGCGSMDGGVSSKRPTSTSGRPFWTPTQGRHRRQGEC